MHWRGVTRPPMGGLVVGHWRLRVALDEHFINLQQWLNIGEVGDVADDGWAVLRQRRLKRFNRAYPDIRQADERRRCAIRRHEALAYLAVEAVAGEQASDHGDVLFEVIAEVEAGTGCLWVSDGHAVHDGSPVMQVCGSGQVSFAGL